MCQVPSPSSLSVQSPQGKKLFVFDRVFDEGTTQEGVWEYVSDSVSSFIKGYNVSILAYGQSGAGKSYTMGTAGPENQADPESRGIVPRAAQALFEKLNGTSGAQVRQSGLQAPKRYSTQALPSFANISKAANGAKDWEMKATYVEIYNEQLRDLLVPESVSQAERSQVTIREDTKGRIVLTGLTQVPINSAEDVLNALSFGSAIRQTDATAINARSSRSHAVFSLNLVQRKPDTSAGSITSKVDKRRSMPAESLGSSENVITIDSKLHFVDLAGSERLKNTGATGDRAKEGISINAGLASLGKVISQLSSKHTHAHISYRDSRLTRLLQDSLGGNAITFMVACVTPAVFHLSETLNTVHYAQRARAIQSKPEIQSSHDDSDKQAAIDRLRAEVTFLRDQIREQGGRGMDKSERTDRMRGRETELQSQLMDMQENYNALSQRHARLIAEISRAREGEEGETPLLKEAIGAHATERIQRSNSFAEAVEQVVLEYETTIQTLESSLSKTRSSLSATEGTLLEKETRIAYMETIQQQLQSRVQKYMDREASNDSYTRDLENKMEGATSDEERREAMIAELRKELARVREGEASAEDYISTLEERLAEAEQDQEIMQREIDRLEHVVDRQRSIGKLDNLLGELDRGTANGELTNGTSKGVAKKSAKPSHLDDDYDPFRPPSAAESKSDYESVDDDANVDERNGDVTPVTNGHHVKAATIGAQHDFMAEKFESLSQEFFDLRSEHEAVVTDYDNLQQKYRTALETLAKLEYDKEIKSLQTPEQSRPNSFLETDGTKEEEASKATHPSQSSAQSSSDLSLQAPLITGAGVSVARDLEDSSPIEGASVNGSIRVSSPTDNDDLVQEMETLRKLHAEKEVSVAELTKNYKSLAQRHEATLEQVRDLKQEVQRSQQLRPSSPSFGPASPSFSKSMWRRRSEELLGNGIGSDRASKSLVSLKTIASNHFEENSDAKQTFEQHLSSVMSELHGRSERVQALEQELASVKKEMESKQTIISGLTRERSSLKASSGVDFSVVGQMRDQLMESENQIRSLHEQHAAKEKEFQVQIDGLKDTIAEHQKVHANAAGRGELPTPAEERGFSSIPGNFPTSPDLEIKTQALSPSNEEDVARLQREVEAWEKKHKEAMDSMSSSQANLLNTIADLQDSLRKAEKSGGIRDASRSPSVRSPADEDIDEDDIEQERAMHREVVKSLEKQIQEQSAIASERQARLETLQESYADIAAQVDEVGKAHGLTEKELDTHKNLVANLENQIQVHKSAVAMHQESLESMQAAHSKEVAELQAQVETLEKEWSEKYAALEEQHEQMTKDLREALTTAHGESNDLLRNASAALGYETDASKLHTQIKGLVEEGKELHNRHLKTTNELKAVQEELQNAVNRSVEMESQVNEIKLLSEERALNLEKMTNKYNKSSRLVEELEEQLNSNFDSHQATNKRLSTFQSETVQARMELERELEEHKVRNSQLEVCILNFQKGLMVMMLTFFTATNCQLQAAIRRLQPVAVVESRVALARGRGDCARTLRLVFVQPAQVDGLHGAADPAAVDPAAAASRLPQRQRRVHGRHRRPRCLAAHPACDFARRRLAAAVPPHLQRGQPGHHAAGRGARGADPYDREAPVRREAAHGDARGGARRPRDVGEPHQVRDGELPQALLQPRGRAGQPAQGALELARQSTGRRGGARDAAARRARPPGARGTHDGAQRGQEEEEQERAQLLLGGRSLFDEWRLLFYPPSLPPSTSLCIISPDLSHATPRRRHARTQNPLGTALLLVTTTAFVSC